MQISWTHNTSAPQRFYFIDQGFRLKAIEMRTLKFILPAMIVLLFGCTAISQSNRIELFETMAREYEQALRAADFKTAMLFLDPAIRKNSMEDRRLRNVRIFQHHARNIKISPDASEISQDVELQYYRVNRNILHTTRYKEIWRYSEPDNAWLLQTALPIQ